MLLLAAVLLISAPAPCAPIEQTPYGRAVLRIEARPQPQQVADAAARAARERVLAQAGVQARWIQVVTNNGSPLIPNPYLPCDEPQAADNEAILKQWVAEMHGAGMAVMSWFALAFCQSGWHAHPEWRQAYLEPWRAEDFCCCFESGYGQALIDYCNYAIERLGLDGIWFDGAVWTPIWERPVPLTCACASCRSKFRADTGLELPTKQDWEDPTFRRWVQWRYREFGQYIGRLAGSIRASHPEAAVVINHYHRPGIPWQSAIPIDRYDADIISGSEAFTPESLDLTVRLCRAYGRSQAEVWRMFNTDGPPEANAETLLEHALICYCAGGYPSYGGDLFSDRMAPTAALMSPITAAIHRYVGGESLPYAALHVSQQTETLYFGRGLPGRNPVDPYWSSLQNWTVALGEAHCAPDYLYDADLTPKQLDRYRVLLMPLSLALTDEQCANALDFARHGGTLLLGLGAGNLDAEGEPRAGNPLSQALGFRFAGVPAPDGTSSEAVRLYPTGGGAPIAMSALRTPLALTGPDWRVLFRTGADPNAPPAAAVRAFGRGHVIVLDTDPAAVFGTTPCFGGKTLMAVTGETAAGSRYSMRFVDDPVAPQTFYPDLENRMPVFAAPDFAGGRLDCDLRIGAGAHVQIEIRSSVAPIPGPIASLGPGGKISSGGQTVCDLPLDQWFHVRIAYRFGSQDKPSTYDLTVTLPGGETHTITAPSPSPDFRQTDWLVIFGAGTEPATFYLDNLKVVAMRPDGSQRPTLDLDFEEGPGGFLKRTTLLRAMAEKVERLAPPPVVLQGPDNVHLGLFQRDAQTLLVHLHDRNARRADWQSPSGSSVTLSCAFPVRSARLVVSDRALPVSQAKGRYQVRVPSVGLYQVVELRR